MYRSRPLFVLYSAAVALLLVASVAVPQPTSQAVVVDEAPQVLLSISKGDREDTFNCRAKNVPLQSVLWVLARVAHANVVVGKDVQSRQVLNVDVRDTQAEPLMRLLAKACDVVVYREDNVWFVTATAAPQQVECTLLVLDAATADLDALFAAHPDPQEQFRLPCGVSLLLGQLSGEVNRVLASGHMTIVNEPHVVTADGQEAEISFPTSQDPVPDVHFPGLDAGELTHSFWVLPHVKDLDHVAVILGVSASWPGTETRRHRRPAPGDEFSVRISLPELTLERGQWLLVRGCGLGAEARPGRETALILTASAVLPKK